MALLLDIVTPAQRVISVQCDEVRAPGAAGGFGIREKHTPFMSALAAGRLTYVSRRQEYHYTISDGFLQVADNKVIVLVDSAEPFK